MSKQSPNPVTAARHVVDAVCELESALARYELPEDDERARCQLAALLSLLDRSTRPDRPGGVKQRIAAMADDVAGLLGRVLPFKEKVTIPDIGVIERTMTGRSYYWEDGRMIAHRLASKVADDRRTNADGEVVDVPPGALAGAIADAFVACAGLDTKSAPWKVTGLDAHGVSYDGHRHANNGGRLGARWVD